MSTATRRGKKNITNFQKKHRLCRNTKENSETTTSFLEFLKKQDEIAIDLIKV
ncbi:MAG: hypothetical protein L6V85_09585 [Clostridiales bacterium]|nr:MAG: hypothetical protein L6V85_09585 [Clostridiales bacterium]